MEQKNDQVLELTDNLLNWAKSQTENLKPLFESVKICEIIGECMELYQPIAEEKDIQINASNLEDHQLWADKNMLRTVFRNLINNAIKFTPNGGSIKIDSQGTSRFATVFVKDSGIGISKEKLEFLFEVDQKKVIPGTAGEKSSGLGLAVCKEFMDAMKGKIRVTSEPEQGSEFCVKLRLFDPDTHEQMNLKAAKNK